MITEALLEMHYHRLFVESFESVFGARFLRLLKPSQRKEAWLGFDQGWISSPLSASALVQQLKAALAGTGPSPFYLAYFLQFKVVDTMVRRSAYAPSDFEPPYYRSELSLEPNAESGMSQHETLLKLAQLPGASVNYACPVLLDLDALYDPPDPATLQFVDVATAPAGWVVTDRHFIAFRDPSGRDLKWCSDPHPAGHTHLEDFIQDLREKNAIFSPEGLLGFLSLVGRTMAPSDVLELEDLRLVTGPTSFTIVELVRS